MSKSSCNHSIAQKIHNIYIYFLQRFRWKHNVLRNSWPMNKTEGVGSIRGLPWWLRGFSVGASVKNPPANAGDIREVGSVPGSGRSPGGGHSNPLQYSCLENSRDRGAWRAAVHRVAKSWIWLKQLSTYVCVCVCVCVCTTSLSIHLSVDIYVVSMSWLL